MIQRFFSFSLVLICWFIGALLRFEMLPLLQFQMNSIGSTVCALGSFASLQVFRVEVYLRIGTFATMLCEGWETAHRSCKTRTNPSAPVIPCEKVFRYPFNPQPKTTCRRDWSIREKIPSCDCGHDEIWEIYHVFHSQVMPPQRWGQLQGGRISRFTAVRWFTLACQKISRLQNVFFFHGTTVNNNKKNRACEFKTTKIQDMS